MNVRELEPCRRISQLLPVLALCSIGLTASPQSYAESQHDLLLFLSVDTFDNLSDPVPSIENSFVRGTGDVLYVYNNGPFRFLAEYIWSTTESEMERFEFGWQASDQTMIWIGRFHTTAKFWTTEYHHGQFMQTSISRPGVEEWEDESGPMPSHVTGISVEHKIERADQSAFNIGLAAGLGPVFEDEELEAFDVLNPDDGHDLSMNIRLAYQPDALSRNQVGILLGWNNIPVVSDSNPNLADLEEIEQLTAGIFVDWHWDAWRLTSSWTYFDNKLFSVDSTEHDDFIAGYAQGEYKANDDWTLFGRTEIGFGEDKSPYLRLLPAFIAHRNMLGVRWDLVDKHSLTAEIADTSTQGDGTSHNNFKEIRFQWSAVFP